MYIQTSNNKINFNNKSVFHRGFQCLIILQEEEAKKQTKETETLPTM